MEAIKDLIFRFLKVDKLIDHALGYVDDRVKLIKLEIREDVIKTLSSASIYALILFLGLSFLLFLSFGLALYLNQYYTESYPGFLIVSGIYLVLFLILLIFRKPLEIKIRNRINKI
ncbi:MAG: hypothetical protein HC811_08820 [Flammeovirgaceae bacterium]|nr:hypothetical protein [Flammeovirgaceae bacterium]